MLPDLRRQRDLSQRGGHGRVSQNLPRFYSRSIGFVNERHFFRSQGAAWESNAARNVLGGTLFFFVCVCVGRGGATGSLRPRRGFVTELAFFRR